jgi:hypothetical protein
MPDVTMNAGKVNVVITADGSNYSAAMRAAAAQAQVLGKTTSEAGHAAVSSMQAASASIRLMEGDITHNMRAVERWISTIPGVTTAMKSLFPLVGGIAFAGMLGSVGEKVVEFVKKTQQIPESIRLGFQQINDSARLANDTLAVTNDRLANEIAKLQGKPQNGLAAGLDEARVNADKLADSLNEDARKLKALLDENSNGVLQRVLFGKGSTSEVKGNIENFQKQMAGAGEDARTALDSGDMAGAANAQARLAQLQKNALAYARDEIAKRSGRYTYQPDGTIRYGSEGAASYASQFGDQTANLNALRGFSTEVSGRQTSEQREDQNRLLQKQRDDLVHKKELATAQAEAQRKADQQQMEAFQQGLADLKNAHEVGVGEEYSYWQKKLAAVRTGSRNYLAVSREMGALYQQVLKENASIAKDADKQWGMLQPTTYSLFPSGVATSSYQEPSPDLGKSAKPEASDRDASEYLKNLNEGIAIRRQAADSIAELSIQMAVATGQMGKLDAAEAVAALHADQYQKSIDALSAALANIANDPALSVADKNAQSSNVQNQIDLLNGSRAAQVMQENAGIDNQTLGGSIRNALNLYVQEAADTAAQIREIMTSAFESVNSSLSNSLMAHAYNGRQYRRNIVQGLSGTARGIGSQVLDAGFRQVEGGVLGRFGLGGKPKPTGAAGDPLHVVMDAAGMAGAGVDSGATALMSKLWGGSTSITSKSGGSSAGGPVGAIVSSLFQGFFAAGGDVTAGRMAIVGEHGPEPFIPKTAGTILPNSSLSGLGKSGDVHFNIDARGSNDPAQTEAAVHRAMRSYAPHVMSATMAAIQDQKRRVPSSRR